MGKSRLIHEFRRSLEGEPSLRVTYLEGRCQSYASGIPYFPVLEILRQNFGLAEGDSPETIAARVRAALAEFRMDPEETAPYLLRLFGVDAGTEPLAALTPPAIRARTFETLRRLTLTGARRRPILFVFEDLHRIDSVSEECFTALMDSVAGAPAMAIVTYRPGYRAFWTDRSYVTQVALQPLSQADSLRVVASLLERPDAAGVAEAIVAKAEGNPFFLEELARSTREATEPQPALAVPETIEEVVLARIGRLDATPRRLLQTAAVIGHELPLPLLRAVWQGPGDLEPALRELTRLEFLYTESGGMEPASAFTHTLSREVAYSSVPLPERRALHAATARALETVYAERLGEVLDRLAFHYARADDAERAVRYLARAAEKAARGHAHAEAARMLDEALARVEHLPAADRDRSAVELAIAQAHSLIPLGRFREIVERLGGHREALERLAEPGLAGLHHFLLARSHLFLGDDARATRHAAAGLGEAEQSGDDATRGKIHYVLAQRGVLSGHPREGLKHGRQAIALLEHVGESWWVGPSYWTLGLNHALLGEFGAALETEARAAASGEAVGDPQLQSATAWARGVVHTALGDLDAGLAACRRAVELSPDPVDAALALGWLGFVHVERGETAQAIPLLEQAIAQLAQFQFVQPHGWFMVFQAEAHRLAGRLDLAETLAADGLRRSRAAHSLHGTAWAERALGRIALARGALGDAEARLTSALDVLDAMGARYDLARTHLDLATVAHARGDRAAGARHVDPARQLFGALGVPSHRERVDALAARFDPPL